MLRHALAPLFEPRSLVVISDQVLPYDQSPPIPLHAATVRVPWSAQGDPEDIRKALQEVAAGRGRPDLALVCVEPTQLPLVLNALAANPETLPGAVILQPHNSRDPDPAATRDFSRLWAQTHSCLLLGPNAFGVQRPHAGFNFSQHPHLARSGKVALVAQSRSIMAAVMDWADDAHIGLSTAISLGDEVDLGIPQVLDYLTSDYRTDSIALYMEETGNAREFMSALRSAARVKPVVVLKAGRAQDGSGADAAFDAALRRAGAVRIRYFVQMFSALKVLGYAHRPRGQRVAMLANGNGPPQLALDLAGSQAPIVRAELGVATCRALQALLEPDADIRNPVITRAPLTPDIIQEALNQLLADANVDGVLVLLTPDAHTNMTEVAKRLAAVTPAARKPVVTCFMGDAGMRPLRRMLDDAGTPAFRTPETAADALGVLATHHYNQQLLLQMQPPLPPLYPPDREQAQALIDRVRDQGRTCLSTSEVQDILQAFFAPVEWREDDDETDCPADDDGIALAIRVVRDARFGPVIGFGAGGRLARLGMMGSGAGGSLDLPPLNSYLAHQMMVRSRIWKPLLGSESSPQALAHLEQLLVQVSEVISELPDIESLALDPIRLEGDRLRVDGMEMRLTAQPAGYTPLLGGYAHMAIHPYPAHLVRNEAFEDGVAYTIRPIRPEDAEALQDFVRELSEQSRYMRFISAMKELTERMLARYTQVDYHRELALVATIQQPNPAHRGHPHDVIIGFAHYLRNADGRGAEYALVIGDDWQRRKLGFSLMQGLIEAARQQGLEYIDGMVLAANRPMLTLMTRLGFVNDPDPDDPSMRRVWLDLEPLAPGRDGEV